MKVLTSVTFRFVFLPSTISVEETIVSNEDYGDGGFDPWNDFILEEVRISKLHYIL